MTTNINTPCLPAGRNGHKYSKRVQKEMIGTVVSDKPDKTVIVKVSHLTVHPVFKKTLKRYNKFKAHDEKNKAKTGDTVKIREARPISKNKCWRLVEVVKNK